MEGRDWIQKICRREVGEMQVRMAIDMCAAAH